MNVARARSTDAGALTAIAIAAKSHWGYPPEWIDRWRDVLTITPAYIESHPTFVAVVGPEIAGFSAVQIKDGEALLDHLWVKPDFMRQGIGRALFAHAEAFARASGAERLKIVGDPHAEPFYRRMGAIVYGREPAPIREGEERYLPLLAKPL